MVPPSPRCIELDDSRRDWRTVEVGAGALAGASGLSSIPLPDKAAPYVIGAGVGLGASAVIAATQANARDQSWVRECSR